MSVRTFVPPVDVDGISVMVETSHALPLVDVVFLLTHGSLVEPRELEGLARFTARAIRTGSSSVQAGPFEDELASLGGRLAIDVGTGHIRFHGTVLARNLDRFVRLVADVVTSPAFRAKDVERVRRETLADLTSSTDDDRWLAGRALRRAIFRDHPLARSIAGTRRSIRATKRDDLRTFHERALRRDALYVGFAGDIDAPRAHALVRELFGHLPKRASARPRLSDPKQPRGLRVVLVDKPDRTQCQILAGTLGSSIGDPLTFPLHVANTAFGGMFSGPLVDEIRVKRGYSYGAGSRLAQDVCRDAWVMSSFPTAEHVVDCAKTMLVLQRAWVEKGARPKHLKAAKDYLVNGRCFEEDTPYKRLEAKLDLVVHDQPVEHWTKFDALVRRVTVHAAADAVRARISADDLVMTVVGRAKTMEAAFRALDGVKDVKVVSHRSVE